MLIRGLNIILEMFYQESAEISKNINQIAIMYTTYDKGCTAYMYFRIPKLKIEKTIVF